jgi:hypothetical protein
MNGLMGGQEGGFLRLYCCKAKRDVLAGAKVRVLQDQNGCNLRR